MLALLVIELIGAGGVAFQSYLEHASPSDALEDTSVVTQADDLLKGVRIDRAGRFVGLDIPLRWRLAYRTDEAAYYALFDPAGHEVARSPNRSPALAPQRLAPGQARSPIMFVGDDQDLALTAAAPSGYRLVVARSNPGELIEKPASKFKRVFRWASLLTLLAAGLLIVWLMSVWSLRPLSKAAADAAAIRPDNPGARLSTEGMPSEVRPLIEAVNAALGRVEAALIAERRFTADAAHALRTPVAVLDLRVQRSQADEAERSAFRADLKEIGRLVTGLLTLARAEHVEQRRTEVNLARLVREAAAALEPAIGAAGRTLTVEAPEAAVVMAEPRALRDAVEAMVDNAVQHGAGRIDVRLAVEPERVRLSVSDEGPGVPPEHQARVFDRFTKLEANSPGAGLGLPIVRQTARRFGGDAAFTAPAAIEIWLPRPSGSSHLS